MKFEIELSKRDVMALGYSAEIFTRIGIKNTDQLGKLVVNVFNQIKEQLETHDSKTPEK